MNSVLHYAVYEGDDQVAAGGYGFRLPGEGAWLTEPIRLEFLDLIGALGRQTKVTPEAKLVYQSLATIPVNGGRRLAAVCWQDYSQTRPGARFLLLMEEKASLRGFSSTLSAISASPEQWLQREVSSPFDALSNEDLPSLPFEQQLLGLDALMNKPRVAVPTIDNFTLHGAFIRILSYCPLFLSSHLVLGHNLRRWPRGPRSSLALGSTTPGLGALSLFDYKPGPAVDLGRALRASTAEFPSQDLLKLIWDLFNSPRSLHYLKAEVRSRVDPSAWEDIEEKLGRLWLKRLLYRNRQVL